MPNSVKRKEDSLEKWIPDLGKKKYKVSLEYTFILMKQESAQQVIGPSLKEFPPKLVLFEHHTKNDINEL